MKHFILLTLLLTASSCIRRASQPLPSPTGENLPSVAIDSLSGYSVRFHEEFIQVSQGGNRVINASIHSIDDDYLRWARELDSGDIGRGFVMARALTGAAIGEPDGCGTNYSIDSLFEYRNQFDVRCFLIRIKGLMYCEDEPPDTSFYAGYFVDISRGDNYRVIQIPNTLDFLDDKRVTEASKFLANNVKIP